MAWCVHSISGVRTKQTPEAVKLTAALRRIRKIQAEIHSGEVKPSSLLSSLTKTIDTAYRLARFVGPDAAAAIDDLARLTSVAVEEGETLYRMRLEAQADFASGRAQLQRKRIDPDSYLGELELTRIWK